MPRFTLCSILVLALSMTYAQAADSAPFLQKKADKCLLTDLEAALGAGSLKGRLNALESRLRPMFDSLPTTSRNLVGHATARYALHRIAVDLHGWSLTGLEPNATTFNTTSLVTSGIISWLLPEHIAKIFEEHIHVDGFSFRDLAILAATVEYFVHAQQKHMLRKGCDLLGLSPTGPWTVDNLMEIVELYMAAFLQGVDVERVTKKLLSLMPQAYPGWAETVLFLEDQHQTLTYTERDSTNPFSKHTASFAVALRVVERIADHFTHDHAEPECQEIKEDLLAYERGDTGRVRLADFYRAGLNSRFFFTETAEYLRAMGALDESDLMWGPKVIVSNYVLAKSNCLASSHLYSVCCINECEGLYGHLEQAIHAPEATPDQIATLVARLSSSTVQAPRNLSQTLMSRLDDMAFAHGGTVLLHSRLFAQWMHQAFPRECPYPHLVGTTTSLGPSTWSEQSGQNFEMEQAQLQDYIEQNTKPHSNEPAGEEHGADMMWIFEDEHIVEPRRSILGNARAAVSSLGANVAQLLFIGLAATLALLAKAHVFSGDNAAMSKAKSEKHFV